MAKRKVEKIDGYGPRERQQVTSAIRQVWQRSRARHLVIKRCTDGEGYLFCEKCKKRSPKIQVDHIEPLGSIDEAGYVPRLFCSSIRMRGLCKLCHAPKTKAEAKERARIKKEKDFYGE